MGIWYLRLRKMVIEPKFRFAGWKISDLNYENSWNQAEAWISGIQ